MPGYGRGARAPRAHQPWHHAPQPPTARSWELSGGSLAGPIVREGAKPAFSIGVIGSPYNTDGRSGADFANTAATTYNVKLTVQDAVMKVATMQVPWVCLRGGVGWKGLS